jgi:threonine synthase
MGSRHGLPLKGLLSSFSLDDYQTRVAIRELYSRGYLADPHSALAWAALDREVKEHEEGVFLCTAHPAKFLEVLEETLDIVVPLPDELEAVRQEKVLSSTIAANFEALRQELASLR